MPTNVLRVLLATVGVAVIGSLMLLPSASGEGKFVPKEDFPDEFYDYLTEGDGAYTNWTSYPGKNGFYEGTEPHHPHVKLYANKVAAQNPQTLPPGSVLVQENYRNKNKELSGIAVMYRIETFDDRNADWYWVYYNNQGTVLKRGDGEPVAGRVGMCANCHRRAKGRDLVFANDD